MGSSSRHLRPPRAAIGVVLVLATVVGLTAVAMPETATPPTKPERPNVIVVMTDDQPNGMLRAMPRTRALVGDAGVRFDDYYVSYPLCCPSRATYLTGQYAHNNGVANNDPPLGGYPRLDEDDTLPVWMRESGYITSHIGKYPNRYGHVDPHDIPDGWDEWRGSVDPTTYWMYGYTLNENGRLRTYGDRRHPDPDMYQTDVYRRKAVDFIDRMSTRERPFFLSLSFLAPHDEAPLWKESGLGDNDRKENAAQLKKRGKQLRKKLDGKPREHPWVEPAPRPALRHKGAFADAELPTRSKLMSYDEKRVDDKPTFLRNYPLLPDKTEQQILDSYRGRLASLLSVDEAIGAIVRQLKDTGELDNTYLMFVSDNGYFFGEHRIPTGKFLPHDASSHVPLMLRGPGIPAGKTSHELTTNTDLAATIADIAGVEPRSTLDGRSLLPFAEHPDRRTQRAVLHEGGGGAVLGNEESDVWSSERADVAGRAAAAGDLNQDIDDSLHAFRIAPAHGQVRSIAYEAIRTERYLYVRYLRGGRELYDLERDPYESRSRAADPAYAETMAFLDDHLDELQGCAGKSCVRSIPDPPKPDDDGRTLPASAAQPKHSGE